MNNVELFSFPSDDALARAAAGDWVKEIEAANLRGATHLVALSGGRIARKFFDAAAEFARNRGPSFGAAHFFWGDERCVPPTDPESNFAAAHQLLLAPLGIRSEQIHRIRGEEDPAFAAQEAEAEICRVAPLTDVGQPILDLVLLGMGEDGHVASLFPEEPEENRAAKAVFRPVIATKPPPRRITLGYGAIAAARAVWVLASGAGKEAALRASLERGSRTPLGRVLQQRAVTKVFSDIRGIKT